MSDLKNRVKLGLAVDFYLSEALRELNYQTMIDMSKLLDIALYDFFESKMDEYPEIKQYLREYQNTRKRKATR